MLKDDLTQRIRRIYAALGAVEENDISKFKAQVINDNRRVGFYQDWKGGLSDEEIFNFALLLIHNIANLRDNLKKWAANNSKDKTKVDSAFDGSQALKVIQDLSNNDKHGYPPRDGGCSGKSPRVEKIGRVMSMSAKGGRGSFISLTFNRQGVPQVSKSGTSEAKVIITGDILDGDGNKIGDLYKTALEAINIWEEVLGNFGVTQIKSP